ncbi:hypothetical protein [Nocardia xishanensis]
MPDNTIRDQLAADVREALAENLVTCCDECDAMPMLEGNLDAEQVADRLLARGVRPPARRIETPTDLDALPGRAIVVGRNGEAWQLTSHDVFPRPGANWGSPYLISDRLSSRQLLDHVGPVTVLYIPTEEASGA